MSDESRKLAKKIFNDQIKNDRIKSGYYGVDLVEEIDQVLLAHNLDGRNAVLDETTKKDVVDALGALKPKDTADKLGEDLYKEIVEAGFNQEAVNELVRLNLNVVIEECAQIVDAFAGGQSHYADDDRSTHHRRRQFDHASGVLSVVANHIRTLKRGPELTDAPSAATVDDAVPEWSIPSRPPTDAFIPDGEGGFKSNPIYLMQEKGRAFAAMMHQIHEDGMHEALVGMGWAPPQETDEVSK